MKRKGGGFYHTLTFETMMKHDDDMSDSELTYEDSLQIQDMTDYLFRVDLDHTLQFERVLSQKITEYDEIIKSRDWYDGNWLFGGKEGAKWKELDDEAMAKSTEVEVLKRIVNERKPTRASVVLQMKDGRSIVYLFAVSRLE